MSNEERNRNSVMNEEVKGNEETKSTDEAKGNEKEKKREPIKIKCIEPADFDHCEEMRSTTTNDLAAAINSIFKIYKDYAGCSLSVNPQYVIVPILYFEVLSDDAYKSEDDVFAFNPISKNNSFIEKYKAITSATGGVNRLIEITEDGKSGLSDFIPHGNRSIDWKNMYSVRVFPGNRTYVAVSTGVSLTAILQALYGFVDEEGTPYHYSIDAVRPVAMVDPYGGQLNTSQMAIQNTVICIRRLKSGALNRSATAANVRISAQLPMIPVNGTPDLFNPVYYPNVPMG